MDDDLHHRINELVDEEHRLERGHSGRELSDDERAPPRRTGRRAGPDVGPPAPPRGPAPGRAGPRRGAGAAGARGRGVPAVAERVQVTPRHRRTARRRDHRAGRGPVRTGAPGDRRPAARPDPRASWPPRSPTRPARPRPGDGRGRRRRLPAPRVRAPRAGPHRPGRVPRRLARRRRRCAARCSTPPRRAGRAGCCRGCGTPAPTAPTATRYIDAARDGVVRARRRAAAGPGLPARRWPCTCG